MIKIELAEINDLEDIMKMIHNCANDLISKNIFQWNEKYPSKEIFREDIKNNDLFVAWINSEIVGCIMLSSYKDDVYKNVKWIIEDSNNLYIHRLAVHPSFQKKGIARKMMDYAEAYAKSKNHKSVRLDTFSKNHRNNKFYKLRGYIKLDDLFFPNQSEFPFHCYEKLIN